MAAPVDLVARRGPCARAVGAREPQVVRDRHRAKVRDNDVEATLPGPQTRALRGVEAGREECDEIHQSRHGFCVTGRCSDTYRSTLCTRYCINIHE
jgi:hypothetical protein